MFDSSLPVYEFGSFRLNAKESLLLRDGQPVRVPPKAFELLLFFVERNNKVIDKDTLMREVWQDTFVEEANLTVHISTLRKILALDIEKKAHIETFPKRGYRFVADVVEVSDKQIATVAAKTAPAKSQEIKDKILDDVQEVFLAKPNFDAEAEGLTITEEPEHRTRQNGAKAETNPLIQTDSEQSVSKTKQNLIKIVAYKKIALVCLLLITIAGIGFAAYKFFHVPSATGNAFISSPKLNITRLVTLGKALTVTMSPDGKYAAYVTDIGGKQSIRFRQIATSSDVEIVSSIEGSLRDLSFTPDSNYLYYVQNGQDECNLFKVPALGGPPTKITGNIDKDTYVSSAAAVSPNGKKIVFHRDNEKTRFSFLQIANADGTEERTVIKFSEPSRLYGNPEWSPDGKTVAFALGVKEKEGLSIKLFGINISDDSQHQLSESSWAEISGIEWLSDGNLIISAKEKSGLRFDPSQLWLIAPNTQPQPITNDPFGYTEVSLSAKGDVLIATQSKLLKNLWVFQENDASRGTQITSSGEVTGGVSWTPDSNLILGSNISGNADIWTLNADGTNRKQLTSNKGTNTFGSMTPDGRFIVFHSNRVDSVQHIFRMNADGSNQIQLTKGFRESSPKLSPDGRWIFYAENIPDSEISNICKISIDGGTPVIIAKSYGRVGIDVSPRNGLVAYVNNEERAQGGQGKIFIISPDGGEPIKTLLLPTTAHGGFIQWTPDERAIAFNDSRNGGANIWAIALDGKSEAKPLTNFTSEQTLNFDWSPDGKQLVASRGTLITDFLLISATK